MATIGGANSLKNGLVLHFDAANTRSFRGEPTVNLATVTMSEYTPYNTMVRNGQNFQFTMVAGGAQYLTVHNGTDYNGKTITISGYMFKNGKPYALPYNRANTYHTVPASKWSFNLKTGYFTIVEVCNTSSIWLFHTPAGTVAGDVITINNLQVEEKTYVTPFINGTRGTTVATGGGFIDISNNNKHAELVNGPIYNSEKNGVLYMDGVNDRILYPNSIPNSTVCTVVMWIATTDLTFLWMSGNDCGYYLAASDTPASNYWHSNVGSPTYYIDTKLVINPGTSADGNFHMFEAKNVNLSTWTTFQFLDYCGGSSWNLNGKIGLIQIYNRNLTAEESLQNYNANKNRFI